MLAGRTVLILGAGSSVDFGLPTGAGLLSELAKDLTVSVRDDDRMVLGDRLLDQSFKRGHQQAESLFAAAKRVARALGGFNSIDDVLQTHAEDADMVAAGKTAIANAILRGERNSVLMELENGNSAKNNPHSTLSGTWVRALSKMLVTGITKSNRGEIFQDLTVINFNYDRCIDVALQHLLQPTLDISPEEARKLVSTLKIYHPYGSLGPLPVPEARGVKFGENHVELSEVAKGLRVYSETLDDRTEVNAMRGALASARNIICLGFGFHTQNLELLTADGPLGGHRSVFATCFGEPDEARATIDKRLESAFYAGTRTLGFGTQKSTEFLNNHRLLLSA